MKFRHCFLIFGVIIALCFGGIIARNAVTKERLPEYMFDEHNRTLLIDGVEYQQEAFFFKPIEKEESPFGLAIGRHSLPDTKEYLYWVDRPGGDWFTSVAYFGDVHFRRKDAVDPEPEDVTLSGIRIQSRASFDAPSFTALLLQGSEEIEDFIEFLFSRQKDLAENELARELLKDGDYIGYLQLLCEEYPRMAFEYNVFRNTDGAIVLLGSGRTVVLNDFYCNIIKEALSQ